MNIAADTQGSDYDTALSVYTGSQSNLMQIACNDDAGSPQSRVQIQAVAGETYFFMVAAFGESPSGQLIFSVSVAPPPPSIDAIDDAKIIGELPFSDSIDTSGATTSATDPDCAGRGPTVWYVFTPEEDLKVAANTFGSNYNTTLSVYTGSPSNLSLMLCNDDAMDVQSRVRFAAVAGETYFIMIGASGGGPGGQLVFTIRVGPPPPSNDDFDNAKVIQELPFSDSLITAAATTSAADADCAGRGNTVWYIFSPEEDVRVQADTLGSNYDTTLSLYAGSPGTLTQLACNDDAVDLQSRLEVSVHPLRGLAREF
jgi:hypothetical protein